MTRDMHLLKKDGCLFLWLNNKHLKGSAVESRPSRRPETRKPPRWDDVFLGELEVSDAEIFSGQGF